MTVTSTPRKSTTPRKASAPRKRTSAPEDAETVVAQAPQAEPAVADEAPSRAGAGGGHVLASVVTFPVTAVRAVAEDVVSTAKRPEALVYWGGLAGLALLGVLEWPAAAAVGVGVAIANGRRRSRS